jgi:TRAP-type C4-dicarboxylate transport system substrate-binding protein
MHFYNTKRPINNLTDFEGLKTRVAGGMMTRIANALKLVPINQPAGKVHESMSGGVIDAVIFPQETLKSFNLEKLVKHATIIPGGLTAAPIFLAMNRAKFEGLSKNDQAALMRASGENLSRITGRVWDENDRAGIESLKKAGGVVATATPALTKSIFAATEVAVDSWLKEVKEKANADGAAILATFRAEAKKAEMK